MTKPLALGYAVNGKPFPFSDETLEDFLSQAVDLIPYSADEYLIVNRQDQREKELPENYKFRYLYGDVLVVNKKYLEEKLQGYRASKGSRFHY